MTTDNSQGGGADSRIFLTTTTSGVRMAYEAFGDVERPPLLLIQGLGAQMLGWRRELCDALAEAGFHVIRFDNRDIGGSQKFPDGGYLIADMADDTAALLDALNISAAHIVGQSMGGMIAQELAVRHPRKVLSLALLYTAASADWLSPLVAERPLQRSITDRESAIRAYLENERYVASETYEFDEAWIATLGGQMYDRDPEQDGITRQLQAVLNSPDRRDRVGRITAPTTILVGSADRLIDPAASVDLHQRIGGSRYREFPGLGHEIALGVLTDFVIEISLNAQRSSGKA